MENKKTLTLSDFMHRDIIRNGDTAELIFDYVDGKPVRLMGFSCPSYYSDFEVREEAFGFFNLLIHQSEQFRRTYGQS